jgi:hypothetical protein
MKHTTSRRSQVVHENRSEGLLIRAEPTALAEQLCRRLVEEVRVAGGALLLAVDPAWAGAINTVLVKKGVRVSELTKRSRCGSAALEERGVSR